MAISKYDLDINKQAIMKPVVILRQGDYGIDTMQVSLSVANEPMDLTGATIKFMGTTAGGKQIIDDVHVKIIDAKSGVFEYVFPSEAASDIGGYRVAYFSIIQANGQSSTMDFRVQVLSGVDISAPVASEYIAHYDTMVSNLNSAYDSATHATNEKMAETVSSLATSAATVLDSALARVNDIDSTANSASSAASNAVSMAASVASAVTSQASYINSVASSAASNVSSVAAGVVDKLNNISVGGRNLVLGTSEQVVQANNWNMQVANIKYDKSLGNQFYASVMINNTDHASDLIRGSSYIVIESIDKSGNILKSVNGNSVLYDATGISKCSMSMDDNTVSVRVRIRTNNMMANTYYSRLKVERGNMPTDWTPAPEDFIKKTNKLPAEARDFNYLATHMQTYQGFWWTGAEPVLNAPKDNWIWSSIEVIAGNDENSGRIITSTLITSDVYFANVDRGTVRAWKLIANDTDVVHKTSNETVAGDKTFSGKTTFSGSVTGGQVNLPASGDLNTLTDTGKYYQTTSVNAANWSNRPSNAPNLAFAVDVIGQASKSPATQIYYVHTTSRMWVRTLWFDGSMNASPWAELANDDNVVHKTSNETVAGDKTFTGNVTIPKNKVTVNTAYGTFTLTKTLDIVHIQSHVSKDIPDNINVPNVVPQGFRPDGVSVPMTFIHGLDSGVIAVNPDGSLYTSSNIVPNTSFLAASWAVAGN